METRKYKYIDTAYFLLIVLPPHGSPKTIPDSDKKCDYDYQRKSKVYTIESWVNTLYDLLVKLEIRTFCYVPDAGHRVLIDRSTADPDVLSIPLATEEEGVALLAGTHLGGKRGVLLMQSSGVGNCINMMSLISAGRFPFLSIVSMRGEFGEQNPWQVPMGNAVEACLTAMGYSLHKN